MEPRPISSSNTYPPSAWSAILFILPALAIAYRFDFQIFSTIITYLGCRYIMCILYLLGTPHHLRWFVRGVFLRAVQPLAASNTLSGVLLWRFSRGNP